MTSAPQIVEPLQQLTLPAQQAMMKVEKNYFYEGRTGTMDFELNEEQRMIRDLARDFAQNEIAPIAARIDETGEFPYETIKKMGELGLMGLEVSPKWGGAGADTVSYVLAMEEISRVCASHGVIMSVNNSLVCYGLEKFGTDEQKERFLKPLASGFRNRSFCSSVPNFSRP